MQKTAKKKTNINCSPPTYLYNPVQSLISFHPVFMQIYKDTYIYIYFLCYMGV